MEADKNLLNMLLASNESINFDFKQRINIDTDTGKAKFIKLFLALANSPVKPSIIVLGVADKPKEKGGVRQVVGAQEDIDEERLQNLVNSYCVPPIKFSYKKLEHSDGIVGIINIYGHRRPYTPKEKYVNLLSEREKINISEKTVFIRHGSTTDTAHPEEIMEMERERLNQDNEVTNEILNELSDISSSLSHLHWSVERIENQNSKDILLGIGFTGIISGWLLGYLDFLGETGLFTIATSIFVPICVTIALASLRIIRIGLLRSVLIGVLIGITIGALSTKINSIFLENLGATSLPIVVFLIWGSIKGLVGSIPSIIIAWQFEFENF